MNKKNQIRFYDKSSPLVTEVKTEVKSRKPKAKYYNKSITLRLSDADRQTLEAIKYHYECEGIKLNLSKIIREYIVHIPIEN